jgi:hypothetical protein
MPATSARRGLKVRGFHIVTMSKRGPGGSGFRLLNEERIFEGGPPTFVPPPARRGFREYPERPVFSCDAKLGHIHWDFVGISGYWFISQKMKSVIEAIDPEAFAFLQCDVRSLDGKDQPVRWLCDVIRVLDALNEDTSTIRIGTASNGSKVYRFVGDETLIFTESVVGESHIFRMKYFEPKVICDADFMRACKSASLKGVSFIAAA